MSEAVKIIVDAYVGLNYREGLEEILKHRRRMLNILQEKAAGRFDVSKSIKVCELEIRIVEAGLDRL